MAGGVGVVWVKIDDGFPEHRKTVRAGDRASFLFVSALCYCARNSRDGFVPEGVVSQLTPAPNAKKLAATLVDVGLFEVTDDGFQIHDYAEYQPTTTSTERVRQWREKHRNGTPNGSG